MKLPRWEHGRQDATKSVQKLTLWVGRDFDVYILKINGGKTVDDHTDPVENKEHHRFNLTLWGLWKLWRKREVQHNWIERYSVWQFPFRFHKFRPDTEEHAAEFFKNTLILSIGWVK